MIISTSDWQPATHTDTNNFSSGLAEEEFTTLLASIRNTPADTLGVKIRFTGALVQDPLIFARIVQMLQAIPAHVTHLDFTELDTAIVRGNNRPTPNQAISLMNALFSGSLTHLELGANFLNEMDRPYRSLPSYEEKEIFQRAFNKIFGFKGIRFHHVPQTGDRFSLNQILKDKIESMLIDSNLLVPVRFADESQDVYYIYSYSHALSPSNYLIMRDKHFITPAPTLTWSDYFLLPFKLLLLPFELLYIGVRSLLSGINYVFSSIKQGIRNLIFSAPQQINAANTLNLEYVGRYMIITATAIILATKAELITHLTRPLFPKIQTYVNNVPLVHNGALFAKEPAVLILRDILIQALESGLSIPKLYIDIILNMNALIKHMLEDSLHPKYISMFIAQLRSPAVQQQLLTIDSGQQKALQVIDDLFEQACHIETNNANIMTNEALRQEFKSHILWAKSQPLSRFYVGPEPVAINSDDEDNELADNDLLGTISRAQQQRALDAEYAKTWSAMPGMFFRYARSCTFWAITPAYAIPANTPNTGNNPAAPPPAPQTFHPG